MLKHVQYPDVNSALTICASLLCVEYESKRPFCEIWQELGSALHKGNYVIQIKNEEATGFATWVKLSPVLSELYVKNLRWITPMEHNTGELVWLLHFAGSVADKEALFNEVLKRVEEKNLGCVLQNKRISLRNNSYDDLKGHLFDG